MAVIEYRVFCLHWQMRIHHPPAARFPRIWMAKKIVYFRSLPFVLVQIIIKVLGMISFSVLCSLSIQTKAEPLFVLCERFVFESISKLRLHDLSDVNGRTKLFCLHIFLYVACGIIMLLDVGPTPFVTRLDHDTLSSQAKSQATLFTIITHLEWENNLTQWHSHNHWIQVYVVHCEILSLMHTTDRFHYENYVIMLVFIRIVYQNEDCRQSTLCTM